MSLARLQTVAFHGLDAISVEIEVDVVLQSEVLSLVIVGLPDTAVRESKDRVLTALKNSGFLISRGCCTINLAPGDLKKEGSLYDFPMALGLLSAVYMKEAISFNLPYLIVGELGLSGELRPIHGALAVALHAKKLGKKGVLLPKENAKEASLVQGIDAIPIQNLKEGFEFFQDSSKIIPVQAELSVSFFRKKTQGIDLEDIKGHFLAKRALEISAAGGHNILLSGPPGSGKTMLAKAMKGILPHLTLEEALETTKIHSIRGLLPLNQPVLSERPFRSPHHTISYAGLIGGGGNPKPGEVSLAHQGILFLDELPEFSRSCLEVLRQPLEDRSVTVSRAQGNFTFPSSFICIAAMNPCPCGNLGHPDKICQDSPAQIERYQSRISGPLKDRFDMHVEVPALKSHDFLKEPKSESSEIVRYRVEKARQQQTLRFGAPKTNVEMTPKEIKQFCVLNQECQDLMHQALDTLGLSLRGFDRVLKVALTIADLTDSNQIEPHHILEALQFRTQEKKIIKILDRLF